MELYSRAGWIFIARLSPPEHIFLVAPESALCEVIESRERSYASQRVISPSSGARERFVPSSRAFPLFQRGDWMIKLPIDSHLFSSPVRPSRRRCGTQVLRPTTKREQPAQSCLRIDLYPPSPPPLFAAPPSARSTSLLVSSVRSRRIRNPTFKHARRFRLMRTNCALLCSDCDRWFRAIDIFVILLSCYI